MKHQFVFSSGILLFVIIEIECQLRCNSTDCLTSENKCFLSGDHLIINCWLDNLTAVTANVTSFLAVATVSNRSWSETFHSKAAKNTVIEGSATLLWQLDLPRLEITGYNSKACFSKEQWRISVNISREEKNYTAEMSLLDIKSEPLLQWSLGLKVPAISIPSNEHVWSVSVSPCAPDVIIAGKIVSPGHLRIKITYSAFLDGTNYNFLMDLCRYISDCIHLKLFDIVLTNDHVLVLTSGGLMISNNIGIVTESGTISAKRPLNWTVLDDIFGCSRLAIGKIKYTKYCLTEFRYSAVDDIIHLLFSCDAGHKQSTHAIASREPFWHWSAVKVLNSSSDSVILDVVYNGHTSSTVILYRKQDNTVRLQVQKEPENGTLHLMFKEYSINGRYNVTHLEMEPVSNVLFAFGAEVLQSYDGGNSFEMIHTLSESQTVECMIFDPHGNKYLLLSNTGLLLFGMIGAKRLITFDGTYLHSIINIDFLGNVVITNLTTEQRSYKLDLSTKIQFWKETVRQAFVPIQTSSSSLTLYEFRSTVSPSRIGVTDIGRVLSYSGGGSLIIQEVEQLHSHPHFVKAIRGIIIEPFIMDTANSTLRGYLKIDVQEIYVRLESASGWTASDVGRCVILPFVDGFLITAVSSSTLAMGVSPLKLNINRTVPSSQWAMLAGDKDAAWTIREDECRHELESNPGYSATVLDIDETITLFATVRSSVLQGVVVSGSLHISLSNPFIVRSRRHNIFSYQRNIQRAAITLTKADRRQGMLSVRMLSNDAVSLRCPEVAVLHTVYLTCDCDKQLVYVKPKVVNISEYLHGNPRDIKGLLLFDLPTNYRPPSDFGIGIPTSDNIYNADPAVPRPKEKFKISGKSGQYKQCRGKANRRQCNCTPEMMYSDDVQFSDCKQRVYRIPHPGVIEPDFVIKHLARGQRFVAKDAYLVQVSEVNNRSVELTCKFDMRLFEAVSNYSSYLSQKWCMPGGIKINMQKTGLFHFRVEVHPGFSFCSLYSEFQVYVDQTFLPYPVPHMIQYGIALLVGGVLFVIYTLHTHYHPLK